MDSFLGNTRPFFQGLPSSTRGYDGSPDDPAHAPPNPTPPATPTLPPAHTYHPYHPAGGVGSAATSLPGLLPPSRPITAATPSHKSGEHAASAYSVASFLPPPSAKSSFSDVRYHFDLLKQSAVASTRAANPIPDPRTTPSPYSTQASLLLDNRFTSRPFSVQPSVNPDNRSLARSYTTQAPSLAEVRPSQPYSTFSGIKADVRPPGRPYSTQATPTSDLRTYPHPFSPHQSLASDVRSLDSKYLSRSEGRSDLRAPEVRSAVRADFHPQQWGQPYRTPEAKPLENLAPSVQISTTPNTVNGSKDALYLGRKPDDIAGHRRSDDPFLRSVKTLQLNGSRDPLYPNGSHPYSSNSQREPSLERPAGIHTKEDSALDLSVKTVRQTPDSTAPDPEKSSSVSPLSASSSDRLSQSDSVKCVPNSVPAPSPSRANKDPSPLPRVTPGISGAPRATPPSHIPSPYGINGSPSPLPSSSPLARAPHILPPAKRPGDPAYSENCVKLPRRSHSPLPRSGTSSRLPPEAHYPVHPSDKSIYTTHKEPTSEQNRGLHLLAAATEQDIKSVRETIVDRRQSSVERRESGSDWKEANIERRISRDPSLERSDLSYDNKDRSAERRDASHERRDLTTERRDLTIEKWNMNPMIESKYLPAKHSDAFDPYRTWVSPSEQFRANSSKAKYPTSVPSTLPQHGARVPPAQPPHPYSTYGRPPDSCLPHTAPHSHPPAHHPQTANMPQTVQSKIYQSHAQPGTSRVPQTPGSHPTSHPTAHSTVTTVTQSYPYQYASSHAHYHQQLQQRQQQQQQRSAAQYPPFTLPQPTKSASASLAPPNQAYPYPPHRSDPSLALYPPKRSNQVSPHPASSPHSSVSPHPSASPHLSASPHSSVSPHPLAASPRPGVSPHPSQQGRTPQSSPHPAHRLPTSSPVQLSSHAYPGSLPPSPYQSYSTHSTPPSRPSSATAQPYPASPHHSKSPVASHALHPPSTHPLHPPHPTRPLDPPPPQEHTPQAHIQQSISTLRNLSQAYSSHIQQIQPGSTPSSIQPQSSQPPATAGSRPSQQTSQMPPYMSQTHTYQSQGPSDSVHAPPRSTPAPPNSTQTASHATTPHSVPTHAPASTHAVATHSAHASPVSTQAAAHTPYSTPAVPPHSARAPTTVTRAPSRPTHSPSHSSHSPSHSAHSPSHSAHSPAHAAHSPAYAAHAPSHMAHAPTHSAHASNSSHAPSHSTHTSLHSAQALQQSYAQAHSTNAPTRPPPPSPHAPPSHTFAPPHSNSGPSYPHHAPQHSSYTSPHSTSIPAHSVHASPHSVHAPPHSTHAPSSYAHAPSQPTTHAAPSQNYAMPHHTNAPTHSTPHHTNAPTHSTHAPMINYAPSHPTTTNTPSCSTPAHHNSAQAVPFSTNAPLHSSHVAPHTTLAPSHPSHVAPHTTLAPSHPSHVAPHTTLAPSHPSHVAPHTTLAPSHPSHVAPHTTLAPSHPSRVAPHTTLAPSHPSRVAPHTTLAPSHPSHVAPHTTLAPSHPSHVAPNTTLAPSHPSHVAPHTTLAPSHPSHVAPHTTLAPSHPSHVAPHTTIAPSHPTHSTLTTHTSANSSQAPPHSTHAPPHSTHTPPQSSHATACPTHALPHSSHASIPSHTPNTTSAPMHATIHSNYTSPRTTNAPTQPPHSSHTPAQSPRAISHTTHAPSHPGYPPHSLHDPHSSPYPSHPSQASSYPSHQSHPPSHPSQVPHHPSYPSHATSHPSQSLHPSQVHPYPGQTPTHPSQAASYPPHPSQPSSHPYAQAYPHPYPYGSHFQGPSHPSMTARSTQATTTQPTQASPRSAQVHPNPATSNLHPPHPYPHPSQSYPHPAQSYPHSSQSQGHPTPAHLRHASQPPRTHLSQRTHPHGVPSVRPPHHPAQPGYPHQANTSQHHPSHRPPPHPHHHPHHPHYQPPRFPHPTIKTEDGAGGSQYPGYSYPTQYNAPQPDVGTARGQQEPSTVKQPEFASPNSRSSQDPDQSRIRTKGEQKSFDPKNTAVGGIPTVKPEPAWPAFPPSGQNVPRNQQSSTKESLPVATKVPAQPSQLPEPQDGQKAAVVFEFKEEDNKQDQSASKTIEPGKAALAEKLQKKIQRAESLELIAAKKESPQETTETKKEPPPPEENEWDSGFSKLMEDLATNPEGVTSKKSKTLARRYLQKVQIQQAIDSDLIVPPPSYVIEEEEDSEPEPPVKFRGKFKSIKDKKVERLILTYASHSDESATEMIPDEDASDFEEELKREIRSKDKKRGHTKKVSKDYESSGSESGKKEKESRKSGRRGRNKENKPNNKQDLDYSYSSSSSSSNSSSDSDSSDDSDSSNDSDSEESEMEEVIRPRRRGKNSRKWESESSDSEEEVIPRRRTRRDYRSSSEEETRKKQQKSKKRKKKQESSDSDDLPLKTRRGKRKKKWDSDDEEEFVGTRRSKKKGVLNKKQQKRRKHAASDEESDTEENVKKTRGRKKKMAESKKNSRRKQQVSSDSSSSESEEEGSRRVKKGINQRKKGNKKKSENPTEDSSENSDIQTKKKSHTKGSLVIESDESDDKRKSDVEEENATEEKEGLVAEEEAKLGEALIKKEDIKTEPDAKDAEEDVGELEVQEDDIETLNDSVIEKLRKLRDEELNREDVREMQSWLSEVNSDVKKQLGTLQELAFRHCWKKPLFGAGDDFLQGWQTDVKKYKEMTGRFPKKLCQVAKHQVTPLTTKGSPKKGRDRDSGKDSPHIQGSSSPAKNTRSKSGIIKTSMVVAEDDKLKIAARPEISSVMQKFFEKVLAETSNDCTKGGLAAKKFNLGPYSAFGTQRTPTGLTPTPSVAPSMMASDDSDLDSLASLRTDLPASDSIPVSKRSIASSLLKKIGRKYSEKRLHSLGLNKSRSILEASNKPQLLPTPGIPQTEKDLKDMSPDQIKIATFFRKETVSNYRDNFEVIVTKNGINEFTPILYQSRTRKRTKQIQDAATVKSVFGSDIPPHLVKKVEESKVRKQVKKAEKKEDGKGSVKDESSPVPVSRASTPAGSVLAPGDDDEDSELRSERSESVLGESSVPQAAKKVRRKFRKFRSGFDYIRKKKKVKPDDETTPSRKRIPVRKHVNWPEESRDVASEVRSWVVNKGLGETVLHKAARLQYHDVVVYCAESPDFDINVRDNAGYTPLHEACNRGHLDIAQVLCAHGAHVNAPGYKGMRPLHEAVENGHGELARLLLAYGADPALTTYAGQTCLALCADTHTTRLVEGYLADLKGRTGETWHFNGPARFFDPDEQGCEIFSNIPAGKASHKQIKAKDETDSQITESQSVVAPSISKPDQNVLHKDTLGELQNMPEKPAVSEEKNPMELLDSIKKEVLSETSDDDSGKTSKIGEGESKMNEEKEPVSICKVEENEEDREDCDDNWGQSEVMLAWSETPLLDIYQVDGRSHTYYLMSQLLTILAKTQTELVIAARTVETLELDVEEFESRAHSCILGSCSRTLFSNRSSVVLVRVTPAVDRLLGIEAVTL